MTINLTNYTNANNVFEQAVAVSQLTDYGFGLGILVIFFLIVLVGLKQFNDDMTSVKVAFYAAFLVSIPFLAVGLINQMVFFMMIIILVGMIAIQVATRG